MTFQGFRIKKIYISQIMIEWEMRENGYRNKINMVEIRYVLALGMFALRLGRGRRHSEG